MKYKVALYRSEEGISVSVPALPGCWSEGDTEEEALANIQDAIREYLAALEYRIQDAEIREVEVLESDPRFLQRIGQARASLRKGKGVKLEDVAEAKRRQTNQGRKREQRFRKGDLVQFRFGIRVVQGEVKEDRGPIGVKGRHLYAVEFRGDTYSTSTSIIELPAVDLQLANEAISKEGTR
jgi:predicted RNase H-like HicB family nuclease